MTPPTRVRQRTIRRQGNRPLDRAWAAMRILRVFTTGELTATAEANYYSVSRYLGVLRRTGYVLKLNKQGGRARKQATFQLIRDTGPLRPHAQTDGIVYDKNLAREFPPEEGNDE